MNKFYNQYHRNQQSKSQVKIIDKNNFTYRLIIPIIEKYLPKKGHILDIGCGAGTIDFYILNCSSGLTLTGIDVSVKAIDICKKSAKYLGLTKKTEFFVSNFPYEKINNRFDLIICLEVIEHIADDKKAIKEIYKLLKPNGLMILSTPSKNAPLFRIGISKNFDMRVGHLRRYSLVETVKIIRDEGFIVIETKKTEGIIRNFLFVNSLAGKIVKYIKFFISDFVTFIDSLSVSMFGESDLFIIAKKPKV